MECFKNILAFIGTRKRNFEQRLRLKDDGRQCPSVTIKHRTSVGVYDSYSWICGDAERNTYFCWPCLVMGDLSKVRFSCLSFILSKYIKDSTLFLLKQGD